MNNQNIDIEIETTANASSAAQEEKSIEALESDQENKNITEELKRESDAARDAYNQTEGGNPKIFRDRLQNLKNLGIYKGEPTQSGYCARIAEINAMLKASVNKSTQTADQPPHESCEGINLATVAG